MALTPTSRCVYCGNTNFGSGCRYSPNNIHVHPDDPKRCSYCGSMNYGKGCRYSSDGIHVHGIKYNSTMKEGIESMMQSNIILHLLNKPIVEFEAYKLGVIDESGSVIKQATTAEELNSFTSEVKTIIQLKKMLGVKLDILNSTIQLESTIRRSDVDEIQLAYYQEQIDGIFNDLCTVVDQALHDNIPSSVLFNCIKHKDIL